MPSHLAANVFLSYQPAPPLDRFVARLWYWEGEPPAHGKDRLMPDGSASLVINLAEDQMRDYHGPNDDQVRRYPGAVLVGAHSRYSVIDSQEQCAVMAVAFRPGGTWPFFDPAADELHNQHVTIGELWRRGGASLRERILGAPTPLARMQLLERELLAQVIRPLQRRAEVDFALMRLMRAHGNISIQTLSRETGLHRRSLARLFTLEVGLTPKLFSRVLRFEHMLGCIGGEHAIDWSELALDCGYFDQSHLIRDCRLIAGFTPQELRSRRSGNTNHIAL